MKRNLWDRMTSKPYLFHDFKRGQPVTYTHYTKTRFGRIAEWMSDRIYFVIYIALIGFLITMAILFPDTGSCDCCCNCK